MSEPDHNPTGLGWLQEQQLWAGGVNGYLRGGPQWLKAGVSSPSPSSLSGRSLWPPLIGREDPPWLRLFLLTLSIILMDLQRQKRNVISLKTTGASAGQPKHIIYHNHNYQNYNDNLHSFNMFLTN